MSTAGKVLVVVIMLASLVWIILTAGVTQLNRNGNKALIDLTQKVAKLQEDVKTTQERSSTSRIRPRCCKSRWIVNSG